MDEDALVTAVRSELGKLSATNTVDIGDGDITREATNILNEIAMFLPIKIMRRIEAIAEQADYDVDENTIRVQMVLKWDTTNVNADLIKAGFSGVGTVCGEGVSEYYNFPSLWTIRQLKRKRNLPDVKFNYNPVEKKLKIKPTPDVTGDIYWYVSVEKSDWTLEKLPEDFEMLFVNGTTWKCLEIVALRRSDLGGVIREGGFVTYPSTELKLFVDDKRDSFYSQLRTKASLYR